MKPVLISSLIALAIGFAAGWAIKSASQDLESFSPDPIVKKNPPVRPSPRPDETVPDRDQPTGTSHTPNRKSPFDNPAIELPDTDEAGDRAKWIRLSEVLGLTTEQSKAIGAAITENQPEKTGETALDVAIRSAGENLQQAILATLTPEQRQAFKKLQERSRSNLIESKAQQSLITELGELDLAPSQREQALDMIRARTREETDSIADSTRLLLEGSFLPIGNNRVTEEGLRMLDTLKVTPENAGKTIEQLVRIRKEELEGRIARFETILTPGQMAVYRAHLEEALANWDQIAAPR